MPSTFFILFFVSFILARHFEINFIYNEKLYVSPSGSRTDGETEPYKTIKMDKVVPLLIEGIKDQQKQIDELKELVTKLMNK